MKESRRQQIVDMVAKNKTVSMQQICSEFHVSINTARADVAHLVNSGIVEKIYGGIQAKEQESIPLYEKRKLQKADIKIKIAEAAAKEIQDGDTVFLDAGTTTMHILEFVPTDISITVITASLPIIERASQMPNIRLAVLPGFFDSRTNSLLDSSTVEYLKRFQFTKAFIGTSSLSLSGSLGVSNFIEYEQKQAVIKAAKTRYLVSESSKCGQLGLLSFASIADIDIFITSPDLPIELVQACISQSVRLIRIQQD